jgi:hypothetical protein
MGIPTEDLRAPPEPEWFSRDRARRGLRAGPGCHHQRLPNGDRRPCRGLRMGGQMAPEACLCAPWRCGDAPAPTLLPRRRGGSCSRARTPNKPVLPGILRNSVWRLRRRARHWGRRSPEPGLGSEPCRSRKARLCTVPSLASRARCSTRRLVQRPAESPRRWSPGRWSWPHSAKMPASTMPQASLATQHDLARRFWPPASGRSCSWMTKAIEAILSPPV